MAGLLVRIRVIETHDQILDGEPAEQLLTEIREFLKRAGEQTEVFAVCNTAQMLKTLKEDYYAAYHGERDIDP